jgi:hypothetical protein
MVAGQQPEVPSASRNFGSHNTGKDTMADDGIRENSKNLEDVAYPSNH